MSKKNNYNPSSTFRKEIKQYMSDRFGGVYCLKCGSDKHMELHHIYPATTYPELLYDKDNLIPLCHDCHKKFHKMYGCFNVYDNATAENLFEFLNLTQIGTVSL